MECKDVRGRLREYALDKIEAEEGSLMTEHIENCSICKRELYMWQEVIIKQAALKTKVIKGDFSEKIRKRMKNTGTQDPRMSGMLRKMNALNKFITSPKGCLMLQLVVISFGFILLYFIKFRDSSILFPILVGSSMIAMMYLLVKKGKK